MFPPLLSKYFDARINQRTILRYIERPQLLSFAQPLHNKPLDVASRLGSSDNNLIGKFSHQIVSPVRCLLSNTSNARFKWRDDE